MRIIFFNVWHGKMEDKLLSFINKEKQKTDIFCFFEVNPELYTKLGALLPSFDNIYYKGVKNMDGVFEGRAIFVSNNVIIKSKKHVNTFKREPDDTGGITFIDLQVNNSSLFLTSIHGKARPGTKLDTPERLKQSEKIIEYMSRKNGPKIIGGDFNLMPQTKSIELFEEAGYRNLIKEYRIKSTRNKLSWNQFPDEVKKFGKQHFADYCFVSPDIKVKSFTVPHIEASDHEPLVLDFDLSADRQGFK